LIFLTILENIEISKKNKIEVISKGHLYWYLQYVYNVDWTKSDRKQYFNLKIQFISIKTITLC
jgi:hypothetical protein